MSASEHPRSVAIVGAGPAGIAAATELLNHGAKVTLIDESPEFGGQYYRQYSAAKDLSRGRDLDDRHQSGGEKVDGLSHDNLTVLTDTLVWGLFENGELALYRNDRAEILRSDCVILATGANERVSAFPGWTLPGVMTAGGVQAMISRDGILPGVRFLVAGTGPLLLAVAVEIAEAGGEVVAIVEGSKGTAPLRHVHHFLRQMRRVRQGWDYRRALRRHGIPVLSGQVITAVHGEERVRGATVASINDEWEVDSGDATRFVVDSVCLNFGFVASTELARMVDCEVAFDPQRGGWYVRHDEGMRATNAAVYVAGQSAGIGGADLAAATGKLAGLSAAGDLKLATGQGYEDQVADARREVEQAQSFSEVLNTIYSPGLGLADLVTPETTFCRCEEVQASAIDDAIDNGALTANAVKRATRCGMGACQGRICAPILASYLERKAGVSPESSGLITARPPIKPLPLGALARLVDAEPADAVEGS